MGGMGGSAASGGGGGAAGISGSGGTGGIPLDGLVLWLDGQVGVTIVNGTVTTWADQSGNALDATQAHVASRPTATTESGNPGLLFDGVNDSLSLPHIAADFSGGLTAVVVVRPNAAVATYPPVFSFSNGSEVDDITLQTNSQLGLDYEVLNDDAVVSGPLLSVSNPTMVTILHSAPETVAMRVNGQPVGGSTSIPMPVNIDRAQNSIGDDLYGGVTPWDGMIFEIAVYNRSLDSPEVGQIESYLQLRWGCCQCRRRPRGCRCTLRVCWVGIFSLTRSQLEEWRQSTSVGWWALRDSRARLPSNVCIPSSPRTLSLSQCSLTRHA